MHVAMDKLVWLGAMELEVYVHVATHVGGRLKVRHQVRENDAGHPVHVCKVAGENRCNVESKAVRVAAFFEGK